MQPKKASRIPIIIVVSGLNKIPSLFFTVVIRLGNVNHFDYTSNKFMICSRSLDLEDQISNSFNKLWTAGAELILVKGDLLKLIAHNIEPSSFFLWM